jgi:hypothetical protein
MGRGEVSPRPFTVTTGPLAAEDVGILVRWSDAPGISRPESAWVQLPGAPGLLVASLLDRSSARSAKRSKSFAILSIVCLASSFLRRSASARFSLARSRQCSGSLTKEAGMSTRPVFTMVHCTAAIEAGKARGVNNGDSSRDDI